MTLQGKSVLVTGGCGFIGSHLVDRVLEERPANLVVVDNFFLGREENLEMARDRYPTLKVYRQDASDYGAMKRIIESENIQVVYNLAVMCLPASLEEPRQVVETNVLIVSVLCELAREGCYETLIHFSSSEAYGSARYVPMDESHPLCPSTPYAASKAAGDHIVLAYRETFGIDATIIRPFNNFGPRQNNGPYAGVIPAVIDQVLDGQPIEIYGDGEQTRDFIFVRETAQAAVRVYEEATTRGKALNIGTGRETSINRLVETILQAMGTKGMKVVHVEPRPGDIRRHCGGIGLARAIIGFEPKISLVEGLSQTVNWYINRRPVS